MAYTQPGAYVYATNYNAVAQWASGTAYSAGQWVRQLAAPAVGSERLFVCIVAGTSGGSEPTWVTTVGAKTTDNTVTWMECTGRPGPNADFTNTNKWTASAAATLGQVIQDVAGTTLFICTTAGTSKTAPEPTWNKTAGATTTDGTATWTSIGAQSNYTGGQYPHARVVNAIASGWSVAGDNIWVNSSHSDTSSSAVTISGVGTAASPENLLSTSWGAFPPTSLSAGGAVATTGNTALTTGSGINTSFYAYGLSFTCSSGATQGALQTGGSSNNYYDNCTFKQGATGAATFFPQSGVYNNCTFVFSNTGSSLGQGGAGTDLLFQGCTFAKTGAVPTALIGTSTAGVIRFNDCDLSAFGSGTSLFSATTGARVTFENCKLGSSVTLLTNNFSTQFNGYIGFYNCDSGATNYRYFYGSYAGTVQSETTTIRLSGASDGTTPLSWNINTTANSRFTNPFITEEITEWNDTAGSSKTATIYIAGANTLTNGDIWMEIEYLGSSSTPIGSVATSRASNILSTVTSVPLSSGISWGGSPTVLQQLQVTFTPQMKGPVKARICVARPSTQVYVDPLLTIA